ncbi:MAG: hypothetical protein ABSD74_08305 [Rhizomicrobium sp.]|jgi:hypothetical protein
MRVLAPIVVIALLASAAPALADTTASPQSGSSGGVVSWLLSAFDSTPAATQSKDSATPSAGGTSEPKAVDLSSGADADKDSYKPDAGEAEH